MDEAAFGEKATAAAFKAPPPPKTVLEALQQRLEKYKSAAEQAQQEGNGSKARRMGRIQKQYEDAIKAHRAGKPIDFDELPTPPGFAPIPVGAGPPGPKPQAAGPAGVEVSEWIRGFFFALFLMELRFRDQRFVPSLALNQRLDNGVLLQPVPLLLRQRLQQRCPNKSKS